MGIETLLAFVAASALLALTPGPAMSLILSNGASHGPRAGLLTVLGNSIGLTFLVLAATFGMTSIMVFVAEWFDWVRFIGAAYLVWLGAGKLWSLWASRIFDPTNGEVVAARHSGHFWQGLAVALSNPKVLLFLGAFLPQFVDPGAPTLTQYLWLAITFVAVVTLVDAGYALSAARARNWLRGQHRRAVEGTTGLFLVAGGLALALKDR